MNLNQIEKQLTAQSNKEIRECAAGMVCMLKTFQTDKTGKGRRGFYWMTGRTYSTPEGTYKYTYSHLDFDELERLISGMIRRDSLDSMVEMKTTNLLAKMDLLS
jgi:hypothetical protein